MGLLDDINKLNSEAEQKESRLRYMRQGGPKKQLAYIDRFDGLLYIDMGEIETKEQCLEICNWYSEIFKEL